MDGEGRIGSIVMILLNDDCLFELDLMRSASIDAIATDPPAGIEFMGHTWDKDKGGRDQWVAWLRDVMAECLRVLKPGGHALVWALPRTSHWTTTAIEDAGFEVRDVLTHHFGTGYPKSLNVGKAIDKRRDDKSEVRVVCRWLLAEIQKTKHTHATIAKRFGFSSSMVSHWAAPDTACQPQIPTWEQWEILKSLIGFSDEMDAEVRRLNERKGTPGEAWGQREKIGEFEALDTRRVRPGFTGEAHSGEEARDKPLRVIDITSPATEAARTWEGWGTALKPASEHWILARKPLSGTVAATVLEHGTGALNIDGCRVEGKGGGTRCSNRDIKGKCLGHKNPGRATWSGTIHGEDSAPSGRWPANLVLSHNPDCCGDSCAEGCPVAELDRQSGVSKSPLSRARVADGPARATFSLGRTGGTLVGHGDSGGASRFFYCPKPSRRERGEGNMHPTVKSVALVRWLVRLVTPPGGTVLDPFMGSGTTGLACREEGFDFVGIERDEEYFEIARKRLA